MRAALYCRSVSVSKTRISSICSYSSSSSVLAGAMATASGLLEETGVLRADARHLLQDVA